MVVLLEGNLMGMDLSGNFVHKWLTCKSRILIFALVEVNAFDMSPIAESSSRKYCVNVNFGSLWYIFSTDP